jgi:hypothetical protein
MLVALVGVAVLSSGGDTPAQIGAPPAATSTPGTAADGNKEDGEKNDGDDEDKDKGDGDGDDGRGNCNGRGNDPCDRDEGGDD